MLPSLKQLSDASYLYAQNACPLGTWSVGLIALGAALLVGMAFSWVWRRRMADLRRPVLFPTISLAACAASLVFLFGRVYATGPFSARVWDIAAIIAALIAPLAYWASRLPWPSHIYSMGRALACDLHPDDAPLPWGWMGAWGLVHVGSMYVLSVHDGLGWAPVIVAFACLVAASAASTCAADRRGLCVRIEVLTPLALPYAASFWRWLAEGPLGVDVDLYRAFAFADPWSPWFDLRTMMFAGAAWALLITASLCWRRARLHACATCWLGVGLLAASAIWFFAVARAHLSHGVTGSDPFCYLQMAADLVERGTARHHFPLAALAQQADVPMWPIVPVGYHPPAPDGWAATVWPLGWPLLLALFYRLGGEHVALWAAPCCAAASAFIIWALVREMQANLNCKAWLAAGLAAFITLTSHEATLRALVPMADAAAQLMVVVMLGLLTRAYRHDALHWSALAGAAFALAYWVRHPLLFLAPAALALLFPQARPWSRRMSHLAAFAVAAALIALPDLFYHHATFGSMWAAESPEQHLLAWRHIAPNLRALVNDGWLRRGEFGYLWPFVFYGLWRQWRDARMRPWALALTSSFGGALLFHLSYSALRWRDLIALFPWLGLWAAHGMAAMWQWAGYKAQGIGRLGRRAVAILVIVVSLGARGAAPPFLAAGGDVWTFGYVSRQERAEYDRLRATLPAHAVIGAGLNSGALARYSGCFAFRPAHWANNELDLFVAALVEQQYVIYLLNDGQEMAQVLPRLQSRYTLYPIGEFDLPAFGLGGEALDQTTSLYLLDFPSK